MGFMIENGNERECEREYFHNGEIFPTLTKAINAVKLDAAWIDFFYDYNGEFYIVNTETGNRNHYCYDGKKVKRIIPVKAFEMGNYRVTRISDCHEEYFTTERKGVLAMRWMRSTFFVLTNLNTNEKKLYYSNGYNSRRVSDPFYLNLYSRELRRY